MPSSQHFQRPVLAVDLASSAPAHSTRVSLKANEVCVGCIVWLPRKNGSSHVGILGKSDESLNATGYFHPAVILAIRSPPGLSYIGDVEVCFVLLTSFSGLDISDYTIRRKSLPHSIPLLSSANTGDTSCLHLEGSDPLHKQSYVRLDNVCVANMSILQSYNNNPALDLPAYHWRLDQQSYKTLMSLLHLIPHEYTPTDAVRSFRTSNGASITMNAPVALASQNLWNAHGTTRAPAPRAAQSLSNSRVITFVPSRDARWAPQIRDDTAGPAVQHRNSDALADLATQSVQARRSPVFVRHGTAMELPPPTTHSTKHRGGLRSCDLAVFLVLGFLLWLLVAFAGWLIWHLFEN